MFVESLTRLPTSRSVVYDAAVTDAGVLEASSARTLNEVRAVIPADCYRRSVARALVALVQGALLWAGPVVALVLTDRWYVVAAAWLLAGLGVSGLFVLGHDASHGALFESRRVNRWVARCCMLPSVHVESAWDLGHNRIHHGYTTRQGFDFVWHPLTVDEYQALGRLRRLRHRLEWSWLGSGAYFLREVWWAKMWRFRAEGKRAGTIRGDKRWVALWCTAALAALALVGASEHGWALAWWTPVKVLVVPFLVFVHVIGWTVYVHHVAPDIRWWERRAWSQFRGQMESTTVLRLPRVVNVLWFHNIFVHVPHHVDARLPFHRLPAATAAIAAAFPGVVRDERWSLRSYLTATRRCKLYDFESSTWLPYPSRSAAARAL